MNVLILTREYPPHIYGGAGVVVDELSRALARRARVEVRCAGPQEVSAPGLSVRGYAGWERLRRNGGLRHARVLEALSVGLAMVADPAEAEVVHTHTWYAAMGGILARSLFDIPLVLTMHSLEPLRPWKAAQLGAGYAVSTWVERTAVEQADRVIAVSEQMRRDILGHFRVDPDRVVVVHNGVDAEAFRPTPGRAALGRHGIEPPYVLCVGRISEQKGIFTLLEAADLLPPGVQVVLCAASPDTPELEARLRAAVAGRPRVLWIPAMLPREEVVELMSHAALFACPSLYEPFGLINLEAMACGAAVVASRVGGIPEVVTDGETGWLVPPGDPRALAAAIQRLVEEPGRAAAFGRAGRRRVEAHFSWDRIAELTLRVYQQAIAAHPAGPSPR